MPTDYEDKAKRALASLSKSGYLNGNKPKHEYGDSYDKLVDLNNKEANKPFVMKPKKKYRGK